MNAATLGGVGLAAHPAEVLPHPGGRRLPGRRRRVIRRPVAWSVRRPAARSARRSVSDLVSPDQHLIARQACVDPICAASAPVNRRPVSSSSMAVENPTRRGNNHSEFCSGISPRRVKTKPYFAVSLTMRMSHCMGKVNPSPTAAPFIAAMIGVHLPRARPVRHHLPGERGLLVVEGEVGPPGIPYRRRGRTGRGR